MAHNKRQKMVDAETDEDDFVDAGYKHRQVVEFHPHCYVQPLALAESRQFDEVYALAHELPARGEEESDA
jgi:hypothetical protein